MVIHDVESEEVRRRGEEEGWWVQSCSYLRDKIELKNYFFMSISAVTISFYFLISKEGLITCRALSGYSNNSDFSSCRNCHLRFFLPFDSV